MQGSHRKGKVPDRLGVDVFNFNGKLIVLAVQLFARKGIDFRGGDARNRPYEIVARRIVDDLGFFVRLH